MALQLIIDGYNLIRQTPELRVYEKKDLELGRKVLLDKLLIYLRAKKHPIVVVFDGWIEGHFAENRTMVGAIQVIFSRQGEKADEVIKRIASQKGEEAIVVTSDRDLGYSCSLSGCTVVSSQEFADKIEMVEYLQLKGKAEPEENETGCGLKGTKKKGPSRRLPKSRRRYRNRVEKL